MLLPLLLLLGHGSFGPFARLIIASSRNHVGRNMRANDCDDGFALSAHRMLPKRNITVKTSVRCPEITVCTTREDYELINSDHSVHACTSTSTLVFATFLEVSAVASTGKFHVCTFLAVVRQVSPCFVDVTSVLSQQHSGSKSFSAPFKVRFILGVATEVPVRSIKVSTIISTWRHIGPFA